MKKLILVLCMIAGVYSINASANIRPLNHSIDADWMKSSAQTWPGMYEGKTYWYKLDKMAKLWWSADGKKWAAVESGAWADKEGKWLKIHEGKLVWSKDGKSWSEVPDWKWEGSDSKWYKFDSKWSLWVNS